MLGLKIISVTINSVTVRGDIYTTKRILNEGLYEVKKGSRALALVPSEHLPSVIVDAKKI